MARKRKHELEDMWASWPDRGNSHKDLIADYGEKWIEDYQQQSSGTLYDWNKATIQEFKGVDVETLLTDPYFLNLKDTVFPGVWEDIIDLWEERKKREVNLALFLEGIGSGKSMKASIIAWLLSYELCMHENPQKHYGLADNSIIAIMLLSRTETQTRRVIFTYVWDRFQSQFNKDYFPVNPKFSRELRIERNRTCIYAGTSSALSALGYNAYSGVVDEANFLEVIEDSKKGAGDIYDAAEEIENAIMNRMTSRFMRDGVIPGMLCMISSPLYPDSFMERKIQQIEEMGLEELKAFYRVRPTWEAKGEKFFPEFFKDNEYIEVDLDTLEIIKENVRRKG